MARLGWSALLQQVSEASAEALFRGGSEIHLSAGERLFRRGDIGDGVYLLMHGRLRAEFETPTGDSLVLASIAAGALVGDHYLFEPGPVRRRGSSLVAAEPSALIRVDGEEFLRFLEVHPDLHDTLRARAAEREGQNLRRRSRMFDLLHRLQVDDPVQRVWFSAGQPIFAEGDPGDCAYVVVTGSVVIHRQHTPEEVILRAGPGQAFGERAMMTQDARAASARAESDVTALRVSAPTFQQLHRQSEDFRRWIESVDFAYRLPRFGTSMTFAGTRGDQPSVERVYDLGDGRRVVSTWVPNLKAFCIWHVPVSSDGQVAAGTHQEIAWHDAGRGQELVSRERCLQVDEHGMLRRLTCTGDWPDLPWLIEKLLAGSLIAPASLEEFECTGRFFHARTCETEVNDERVVCTCLGLTRMQLAEKIKEGHKNVAALCAKTGCGSVCGGCLPTIAGLLGKAEWIPVTMSSRSETRDVRSIALTPEMDVPLRWKTGQHIVVSGRVDGNWVNRCYTLIAPSGAPCPEIAVKREPRGLFSRWLFDGDPLLKEVRISMPKGESVWNSGATPTTCLVAGIGITPALAIVRAAARAADQGTEIAPVWVHYSGRAKDEMAFAEELTEQARRHPFLTVELHETNKRGRLDGKGLGNVLRRNPGAHYFICGPVSYIEFVVDGLRALGVPAEHIHEERFVHTGGPLIDEGRSKEGDPEAKTQAAFDRQRAPFIARAYQVGLGLALSFAALLSIPASERWKPTGPFTGGHENLSCADCHTEAPGTARQQLQAKVQYLLGNRRTNVAWQHEPAGNSVCMDCHVRPKDVHAPHRFLEARYEAIREELGPHHCVRCHQEHRGRRVSLTDVVFCSACHQEMDLQKDPLRPPDSPTHQELANTGQWQTCLGCHDYHGNHARETPHRIQDAVPSALILRYFQGGESPYGTQIKVKALRSGGAPSPSSKEVPQ